MLIKAPSIRLYMIFPYSHSPKSYVTIILQVDVSQSNRYGLASILDSGVKFRVQGQRLQGSNSWVALS